MAILCASEREDWPGTCLWRVFKAPICCRSLSPACYLGLIVADKGWGEGLDVHLGKERPIVAVIIRRLTGRHADRRGDT